MYDFCWSKSTWCFQPIEKYYIVGQNVSLPHVGVNKKWNQHPKIPSKWPYICINQLSLEFPRHPVIHMYTEREDRCLDPQTSPEVWLPHRSSPGMTGGLWMSIGIIPRHPNNYILRRHLESHNIPTTPSQEVVGCLGIMLDPFIRPIMIGVITPFITIVGPKTGHVETQSISENRLGLDVKVLQVLREPPAALLDFTHTRKDNLTGDSSRDLFIPYRLRSLNLWRGHLTIPKRSQKELPGVHPRKLTWFTWTWHAGMGNSGFGNHHV